MQKSCEAALTYMSSCRLMLPAADRVVRSTNGAAGNVRMKSHLHVSSPCGKDGLDL